MQASGSFSASRQGRPRPANLFPGNRSASDERPWPSPSFNSSMSLDKVDDVFADGSRGCSSGMKRSLSSLPPTPITASMMASPGLHRPKLPGLTDLFVNDEGILGPMTPLTTPKECALAVSSRMAEGGSPMQSPIRSELIILTSCPSQPQGFAGSFPSPSSMEFPKSGDVIGLGIDLETTPKASEKQRPDAARFAAQAAACAPFSSPPFVCPAAPRLGSLAEGMFASNCDASPPSWSSHEFSARSFVLRPSELRSISMEREAVVELDPRLPQTAGLLGLALGLAPFEAVVASPSKSPLTAQAPVQASVVSSSPARSSQGPQAHTGLTPLVRSTRLDASFTPSRSSSPSKRNSFESPAILPIAQLKSSKASTSKTMLETPIKSKPIFRLDNGSSSKKKVQGHKMHSHESPWGVFGVKDEWRPLAAPNSSRSGAAAAAAAVAGHARKGSETAGVVDSPRTALALANRGSCTGKENVAPEAKPPTPGKRNAQWQSNVDATAAVSSPLKKHRGSLQRPKTGSGTPMKENDPAAAAAGNAGTGVFHAGATPQKRMRAASSVSFSHHNKQPVGLR
ncbi:hypothetical protein ACQY0O_005446 [Thecaphora frezii]